MTESVRIEEYVTRLVAVVDWTDECEVQLRLRKRTTRLTADQARRIASALTRCADAADRARASAVRPVEPAAVDLLGALGKSMDRARKSTVRGLPSQAVRHVNAIASEIGATVEQREHLSPDCAAGKHPLHLDEAWDDATDVDVPCECPCHTTGAA